MPLLLPTGPPTITYEDPASEATLVLQLPRPHTASWLQGVYVDASRYVRHLSGLERLSGAALNRRRFAFGYRYLPRITAEKLILALSTRVVTLTPRTFLEEIDPPEAEDEVVSVLCRVTSDVPFTEHIQIHFQIDVELEAIAPPVPAEICL